MKTEHACQYLTSVLSPCQNKASLEVNGEWICRGCAAVEKGRLEVSKKVLQRAMSKVDAKLKELKGVKAAANGGAYRVILRADGEDDDV